MTCYSLFILFLLVLVFTLDDLKVVHAVEFKYPIRNMSAFITESKLIRFSSPDYGNYTQIVNSPNFIYIVSNGNELLKLTKGTFQLITKFSNKTPCTKKDLCEQININVVQRNQEKGLLWFCFAHKTISNDIDQEEMPNCYLPNEESLSNRLGQWQGQTFTSSDFEHRTVSLPVSNFIYTGLYYYADKQMYIFKNPTLFGGASLNAQTIKLSGSLLKAPGEFLYSFKHEYSIYFLFLETDFSCGFSNNQLQTRMLRICDDDVGSTNKEFTAFAKINMNCELKPKNPNMPSYTFGIANAASWIPQTSNLVVSFISSKNEASFSVLCIYSIKSIEDAFNSDLRKSTEKSTYNQNSFKDTCQNFSSKALNLEFISNIYVSSKTYPLRRKILSNLVVFEEPSAKISHISSDESIWSTQKRVVLYLGVDYEYHSAIIILSLEPIFCVLEKFLMEEKITVLTMINEKKPLLYIGTSQKLFALPSDRCKAYITKESCVGTLNPYCGWNSYFNLCIFIAKGAELQLVTPSENICPKMAKETENFVSKLEVPCGLYSRSDPLKEIGTCNCWMVNLDNDRITVSTSKYCKVDGDWSPFSEWSDCSVTCDSGTQTRSRNCDNPSPQNGGKACEGLKLELRYCNTKIECKKNKDIENELEKNLSPWSLWSACSKTCGFSYKLRVRNCLSGECGAILSESQLCELPLCQSLVSSEWSEWSQVSTSESPKTRLRIRCSHLFFFQPYSVAIKVILKKNKSLNCDNEDCFTKNEEEVRNGKWSAWSLWSPCSVTCGVGMTERSRKCINNNCFGSSVTFSKCNIQPCKSTWSCWSDWMGCSSLCETPKIKSRQRYCMQDILKSPCIGSEKEETECGLIRCASSYGQWSMWSGCTNDGVVVRNRKCKSRRPCLFSLLQSKPCSRPVTNNKTVFFSPIYMIVSGLIGLLTGVIVAATICYIWWRCTITVIQKARSESIKLSNHLQTEDRYDSQFLNTDIDTISSLHRIRSSSNNDSFYQNRCLPQYRDEGDGYSYPSPPTFFSSASYLATREPLREEIEDQ